MQPLLLLLLLLLSADGRSICLLLLDGDRASKSITREGLVDPLVAAFYQIAGEVRSELIFTVSGEDTTEKDGETLKKERQRKEANRQRKDTGRREQRQAHTKWIQTDIFPVSVAKCLLWLSVSTVCPLVSLPCL